MIGNTKIENKWQKAWERAHVFEPRIEKKKKFFITFPYPYMNGAPHIGHSYSAFRTDAYARYKRMLGFNVLYPQGFHATGEPILGIIERLRNGDQSQIATLREYGVTDRDIELFEKDPKNLVFYFVKRWTEDLKASGMSIDWRRTFITTTITPSYSRFIEWQYNTLRAKGYVVQGTHPVVWCPRDQSPTGDHDRLVGEGESPVEYTLVKFRMGDVFLPAATLRPETVYGVTNIWLNPAAEYVEARVNGEKWIVSRAAVQKISDQLKRVTEVHDLDEKFLFGRRAINPVTGKEIPLLPADFVDAASATGVVMSVPAHAPFDWIALRELINSGELEHFVLQKEDLQPISVVGDTADVPARTICEKMGITSANEKDALEAATSELYKKEFHTGVLNANCGPYNELKVSEVKDRIIADFRKENIVEPFFDVNDVVCRCTTKCHVKILENQWFIKYSDEKWKNVARRALSKMSIYPEEARNNFLSTIDWLKDKACTRRSGLGTPLPWDKSWIVETLSDSTIYMAYYTIANVLKKYKVPAGKLSDEAFDYIFFGKGKPGAIARKTKLSAALLKSMKKEFDYFYPVDFRNSGKDLVQHHLTFFIFQHVALWPEDKWPRGIGVNGYMNVEGEKMSKSRGNVIPLRNALREYGADLTRINIITSSEGLEDADWRVENLKGLRIRYDVLLDTIAKAKKAKKIPLRPIDLYLQSRMQKIIKTTTENFEALKFRTAANYALFEATNEIRWYMNRCDGAANKKVLDDALSAIVRLLTPLTPHVCEEMWHSLENKNFVSVAPWPKYDEKLVDENAERSESFVRQTIDDIREIQKMLKMRPKRVAIYVADDWKFNVYNIVEKNKAMSFNDLLHTIMATDAKRYGNATVGYVQVLSKKANELQPVVAKHAQLSTLQTAKAYIENEIGTTVEIIDAQNSDDKKARSATPQKPGILLE